MAERIFIKGLAISGPIGSYNSTKGIYINPLNSPKKFQPAGMPNPQKTNLPLPKPGQHKTRYFSSYKAFRQFIGRETAFVNLDLSGRLRSNFLTGMKKVSAFEWTVSLTPENLKKARGMEKHFDKKIFSFTKEEREYFVSTLNEATLQILNTVGKTNA